MEFGTVRLIACRRFCWGIPASPPLNATPHIKADAGTGHQLVQQPTSPVLRFARPSLLNGTLVIDVTGQIDLIHRTTIMRRGRNDAEDAAQDDEAHGAPRRRRQRKQRPCYSCAGRCAIG